MKALLLHAHTNKYMQELFDNRFFGLIGSFFMGVFSFLYGAEQVAIYMISLFILLLVMDWISGSSAAKRDGIQASSYGINGLFRTAVILFIPAVGHLVDMIFNLPNLAFSFLLLATSVNILKSLTANVVRAGWDVWIPVKALEWVADEIEHKTARAQKRAQERMRGENKDE